MLLLIENSTTNIISFIIVVLLIIALLYSIIVLRRKNELIEEQNKQLEEQNQQLIKINEEKSNLISVVSHDLKSPFNRIFALLNLMKITTTDTSAEQKEYLSKMHQVIKDGLALIRNLLDLRAIEEEGIQMQMEELDIVKVIKESMKSHKPLADIKEIKFKYDSEIKEYSLTSDRVYLSRIFDNLLSNALKFSEKGGVVVVGLAVNDLVKISVKDEGPGISVEDQGKLFQKYQVLSAKPTDGESSTGLGLSIVRSLVNKLDGKISCNSKLEEGAEFIVELPTS